MMVAIARDLMPVQLCQEGLVYRVARQKFNFSDVDPMDATAAPPSLILAQIPLQPATMALALVDKRQKRIKMRQAVDQAYDSEIADLSSAEHSAFWIRLKEVR